ERGRYQASVGQYRPPPPHESDGTLPRMEKLPSYDELPVKDGKPANSSWGLWGDDDVFGCLNLMTPERVVRAAGLVKKGRVFALNWEAELPDPPLFGRAAFEHDVLWLQGARPWRRRTPSPHAGCAPARRRRGPCGISTWPRWRPTTRPSRSGLPARCRHPRRWRQTSPTPSGCSKPSSISPYCRSSASRSAR